MKGQIIEDIVCDGALGYSHGQFFSVKRIVVDQMVITIHDNKLYVIKEEDFDLDVGEFNVIGSVEIDDGIVNKFRDYIEIEEELHLIMDDLKCMIENVPCDEN